MHLWDRFLFQATTTLNHLRQSRLNPRLSAEAQLKGPFDFNRTPMAPPGARVIVHSKPFVRRSWDAHGADGWYISHAPEHYRCYQVYVTKTRSQRTADTVEFFPPNVSMPKTSSSDRATFAALDLADALQNPAPAAPFTNFGQAQLDAIRQLTEIFQTAAAQPTSTVSPAPAPTALPTAQLSDQSPPREPASPLMVPASPPMVPVSPPIVPASPPGVPVPALRRNPTRHPISSPRVATSPPPHCYHTRLSPHSEPLLALVNHVATIANQTLLTECTPIHGHHFANSVINPETGQSQEYKHLIQGPDKELWTSE
jgi:hypothetical protein